MTDELCDKCGIGFFLPSGRCDHCNCLQCLAHVRELLTPEEKATHEKWEREAKSAELQRVIEARGLVEKYKDVDTSQADIPYAKGGLNAQQAEQEYQDAPNIPLTDETKEGILELQRVIKARDSKALEEAVKVIHGGTEKVTPEHLERTFNARRRGAVQALRAISDWALERSSEPDEENAVRAYYHCYETCMSMIDQYNEGRKAFGDEVA